MTQLGVSDVLKISNRGHRNINRIAGVMFSGVSTDSRSVRPGEIFFALKGEKFDGHRFVEQAVAGGASLAVVDSLSVAGVPEDVPALVVADTTKALGQLANLYRSRFTIPVLAVGGSNGKTTTKEMIAMVLGTTFSVLATEGNLNNHIGVPLMLFRLRPEHQAAVIEIGTNHPGEIEYLCRILDPTHGVITCVGSEHLEFFQTLRGVASEEGALFRYLRKRPSRTGIVNADDRHVLSRAKGIRQTWKYGFNAHPVRVRGSLIGADAGGSVRFSFKQRGSGKATMVRLRVPGQHNAMNALAAAACGLALGVRPVRIAKALSNFRGVGRRMEVIECSGIRIINDVYNANPDSTIAALETLAGMSVEGKRIAVLADMKELGDTSAEQHARVGKAATKLGIDYLLTHGKQSRSLHESAGIPMKFHYEHKNVLSEYLLELVGPGDAVLIKGSRGMMMEDVVAFLIERLSAGRRMAVEA